MKHFIFIDLNLKINLNFMQLLLVFKFTVIIHITSNFIIITFEAVSITNITKFVVEN